MNLAKDELMCLLQSAVSTDRTIAAKLLGHHQDVETMNALINALIVEKKLYAKIALTESICLFGGRASEVLIKHLGEIGNNQYKKLPDKPFKKNNYPLPRDIVARTLCKIGVPALDHLKECMHSGAYSQIVEAVDAIGFISYYHHNNDCFEDILELFIKYKEDNLMIWKLIRSLQAFSNDRSIELLKTYTNSDIKQFKWESLRSLEQIKSRVR